MGQPRGWPFLFRHVRLQTWFMYAMTLRRVVSACALAGITACRSIDPPTVPSTILPTPSATLESTATQHPVVTISPTQQPTIPIPVLHWADGISAISLGNTVGHWSPVDDSLLLTNCSEFPRTADRIILTEASDFSPHILNDSDFVCDDNPSGTITWSLDGSQILFAGKGFEPSSRYYSTIWIMSRDGSNARPLDAGVTLWWSRFLGWMDDSTIVVASYTGGGSHEAAMWNTETGEQLARSVIWGGWSEPSKSYVAGQICMPTCFLTAMSTEVQSKPVEWYPMGSEYGLLPDRDHVSYLELTDYAVESLFHQWINDSNEMLFSARYWKGEGFAWGTWLGKWDIDEQTISMLTPDGFYGRVSTDEKYLMYLTVGPQQIDSEGQPLDNDTELILADERIYLQLYDVESNIVVLSDEASQGEGAQAGTDFAFAPNSRYAAAVIWNDTHHRIAVIDLQTLETVFSVPSAAWKPAWSADSQRIIFRDVNGELAMLMLPDLKVTLITQGAGDRQIEVQWAHDSKMVTVLWAEGNSGDQELAVIELP
jgi:hypothetical protein